MSESTDWQVPMSSLFRVGVVTTAHGIKGAVKVYPTTDDPRRFQDLEKVSFSRTGEEEDILQYGVKIISYEYADPIENTFEEKLTFSRFVPSIN